MANLENLKLSLDLMRRVRDEEKPFSLQFWEKEATAADLPTIPSGKVENADCGMVCCVGGYMMNDHAHNALGLRRDINNCGDFVPLFFNHERFGTGALALFWDITEREAECITLSISYPSRLYTTIHEVIERLEDMIQAYADVEAVDAYVEAVDAYVEAINQTHPE